MAEAKTERASDQKLARARGRGELQPSALLACAGALAGMAVALQLGAGTAQHAWRTAVAETFARIAQTQAQDPPSALVVHAVRLLEPLLALALGPLLAAVLGVVLVGVAQSAGVRPLAAGERASLGARVAALFSFDRASGALVSFLALLGLIGVALWTIQPSLAGILSIAALPRPRALQALDGLCETLVTRLLVAGLVLGVLDAAWRRVRFHQRQRMTRREQREEQREQYGDPYLRAERTRRARGSGGAR